MPMAPTRRHASPLQRTARRERCDAKLHGVEIPAGSMVMPVLGVAIHDPGCLDRSETREIGRPS